MIRVTVDPSSMQIAQAKMAKKVKQAEYSATPTSMTEIAKAAFTLTGKRFITDIGIAARNDPSSFHHLYEWNKVGNPEAKLFLLQRSRVQYGNMVVAFKFIRSTSIVPIRKELTIPGKNGKFVSAQHIFRYKAKVMEEGNTVRLHSDGFMAFYSDRMRKVMFIPPGVSVFVKNPGGDRVKGSLQNFASIWYSTKPAIIIEKSRLMNQIAKAVAEVANSESTSITDVNTAIRRVTSAYSEELMVL